MKKIILPFMGLMFLIISCNNDQTKDSTEAAKDKNEQTNEQKPDSAKKEDDQDFAVEAASGGMMEVQLGQYAAKNASSPKVKEFGQTMVTDHSKANDELKAIAASKNISLPSTPGEKHQKHIDDLMSKKGADFDKAYIDMMVDDHEEDISNFDDESNKGKDAEIKAFAAGKVPVLKHHLEMAKSIKIAMKN